MCLALFFMIFNIVALKGGHKLNGGTKMFGQINGQTLSDLFGWLLCYCIHPQENLGKYISPLSGIESRFLHKRQLL